MKEVTPKVAAVLVVGLLNLPSFATYAEEVEAELLLKFQQGRYSTKGADGCLMCHGRNEQLKALFATPHGDLNSGRSPMAQLQCESCHGPQGKHKGKNEPMINFGQHANLSAEAQNSVCLGCHENSHSDWVGSRHDNAGVSCTDCHQVHAAQDPVLTPRGKLLSAALVIALKRPTWPSDLTIRWPGLAFRALPAVI